MHYIKWYWGELLLKIHEFRTKEEVVYISWIPKEMADDHNIEWDILRLDNYYVHIKE